MHQKTETEVHLYGKFVTSYESPTQTIKVVDIISPVYFLATEGNESILVNEIKAYTSAIDKIEQVKRGNIFHKALKRHLNMLKITFTKKISFSDFESDHCELVLTEFQNPVENVIISRGIKGPGIVKLENLQKNTVNYKDISFSRNSKFPGLKTASISFELKNNSICKFVYFNKQNEIFYKAQIGKSADQSYRSFFDIKDVVAYLNEVLRKDSPDIIIVHNFHLKSKINVKDKIFCDVFSFSNKTIKGRDFSIQEICNFYKISKLSGLEGDTVALVEIFEAMNALNLGREMAEISGYLLNKCLSNCRAERIEYTLLHELYSKDYLFPAVTPKQNIKYSGGLVLEPAQGFYEDIILLLDFNSLYPSIIQEFNVCFSTIGSSDFYLTEDTNQDLLNNPDLLSSVADITEESFLPKILRNLVKRRRSVKEMIKTSKSQEERTILDIRQNVLKLTANSIYGCLGSPISRFCNFEMAAFITAKGRELLCETKIIAEGMNMKVIYGDTDSIMIHTKYPGAIEYYSQAVESAQTLVTKINSKYKNIEIELEKAFKKLVLYTKKKYAALVFDLNGSSIETKGLDVVRRDFCQASIDLNQSILNIMLQDRESYSMGDRYHEKCQQISKIKLLDASFQKKEGEDSDAMEPIKNNTKETVEKIYSVCIDFYNNLTKRPVEDFVISSVLSKDLNTYNPSTNLPHVGLALRLRSTKNIMYFQDDVVSYVIGEGDGNITSRAFHPDENFKVDYLYYIKNQILPPLFRLVSILSYIHPEKIVTIFNVKSYAPKTISKSLVFISPCCENIQEPAYNCDKCNETIPKQFYIRKICSMLDEGCSKCYRERGECIDCGIQYSNHLYRCFNCNKELHFDFKSREFDELLSSIESSFSKLEIPEISRIVSNYSAISSYREIDMGKYFKDEIVHYKELKQYK